MRRLLEDLTDLSRWQRCCRKPDLFEVTYSTTHAVYLNKTDNTVTTANKRTPIVDYPRRKAPSAPSNPRLF